MILDQSKHIGDATIAISPMLEKLYGGHAKQIYDRLNTIDPSSNGFNEQCQRMAYDFYWSLPGLSMREKSLVTITALMVSLKAEQTRIHLMGFMNTGGTVDNVLALLFHLKEMISDSCCRKGFAALADDLAQNGMSKSEIEKLQHIFEKGLRKTTHVQILSPLDTHLVDIAATVASGKLKHIDTAISNYLNSGPESSVDVVKQICNHLVVYCGYPTAFNGFARLHEILRKRNTFTAKL